MERTSCAMSGKNGKWNRNRSCRRHLAARDFGGECGNDDGASEILQGGNQSYGLLDCAETAFSQRKEYEDECVEAVFPAATFRGPSDAGACLPDRITERS